MREIRNNGIAPNLDAAQDAIAIAGGRYLNIDVVVGHYANQGLILMPHGQPESIATGQAESAPDSQGIFRDGNAGTGNLDPLCRGIAFAIFQDMGFKTISAGRSEHGHLSGDYGILIGVVYLGQSARDQLQG